MSELLMGMAFWPWFWLLALMAAGMALVGQLSGTYQRIAERWMP